MNTLLFVALCYTSGNEHLSIRYKHMIIRYEYICVCDECFAFLCKFSTVLDEHVSVRDAHMTIRGKHICVFRERMTVHD